MPLRYGSRYDPKNRTMVSDFDVSTFSSFPNIYVSIFDRRAEPSRTGAYYINFHVLFVYDFMVNSVDFHFIIIIHGVIKNEGVVTGLGRNSETNIPK